MNAIKERKSIRKYKPDDVKREDIEEIIKAGILAPSAKNRQPWKYIVYTKESKNNLLDEMENHHTKVSTLMTGSLKYVTPYL